MDEFGLNRAQLKGEDWSVEFARQTQTVEGTAAVATGANVPTPMLRRRKAAPKDDAPKGTPITSPMMGIYYAAASPGTPNFIKEGDSVVEGQVLGLIEAMKVFNELTAPRAGTVGKICVENGQLVQPGNPIVYIL